MLDELILNASEAIYFLNKFNYKKCVISHNKYST